MNKEEKAAEEWAKQAGWKDSFKTAFRAGIAWRDKHPKETPRCVHGCAQLGQRCVYCRPEFGEKKAVKK